MLVIPLRVRVLPRLLRTGQLYEGFVNLGTPKLIGLLLKMMSIGWFWVPPILRNHNMLRANCLQTTACHNMSRRLCSTIVFYFYLYSYICCRITCNYTCMFCNRNMIHMMCICLYINIYLFIYTHHIWYRCMVILPGSTAHCWVTYALTAAHILTAAIATLVARTSPAGPWSTPEAAATASAVGGASFANPAAPMESGLSLSLAQMNVQVPWLVASSWWVKQTETSQVIKWSHVCVYYLLDGLRL